LRDSGTVGVISDFALPLFSSSLVVAPASIIIVLTLSPLDLIYDSCHVMCERWWDTDVHPGIFFLSVFPPGLTCESMSGVPLATL